MKKLQNNFTTPEQSKRLLELGVPADSADCYYSQTCRTIVIVDEQIYKKKFYEVVPPIWSVGRLIEIYLTCALECHPYDDFYTETPNLHLIAFDKDRIIDEIIEMMFDDTMDFAKLED